MSWDDTKDEWDAFLQGVRLARSKVGATYAGAWFRGQGHDWPLLPSIYRATRLIEKEIEERRRQHRALEIRIRDAKSFARRKLGVWDGVDDKVRQLQEMAFRVGQRLKRLESSLPDETTGRIHGEGRAFTEYRCRSGAVHQSSWQTLAEMQHYGVPTRLLDWTESFVMALAFALQDHYAEVEKVWRADRREITFDDLPKLLKYHDVAAPLVKEGDHEVSARPVLWVMNPYRLSQEAADEEVLWDMTSLPRDDYFSNFIAGDAVAGSPLMRFEKPLPLLSPWRDERIAAQQGLFTCHTKLAQPIDELCGSTVLLKVPISTHAALHGVRFLYEFAGLDIFTIFRDRDHLGKKTSREFFRYD